MARGVAMSLLVLSLMAVSIKIGDASRVNEQNNNEPSSFDDILESGEDEDVEDLSNAVERLLQSMEAEAASRRMRKYKPEVRPSEIDFEVYDENDKESRRSNRFDDSHESQRLQSNVIAREVGQIRSSPYNDFRSRKPKLSDDNEEQMKRNNFNGFRSQRGSLSPDGKGQIKRINGDDIRLQSDTRNPNCKGEKGVPSRKCPVRLTKDGEGQTKRNQFNGFRIQREEINPNCKGEKDVPSRDCGPRLTKDGGGHTKRNQLNGFRIQREEINSNCKGEKDVLSKDCNGQEKRNDFNGFRIQREESKPECEGTPGIPDNEKCKIQMKINQFDDFRSSLSNLNPADKRAVQIRKRKNFSKILRNRQNYGDLGTLQTEGRQVDKRLLPIQSGNFDYLDVELDIQSHEIDQAELQANDYNSDEQLTNREDVDGEESRQIHDDRSQRLQPETNDYSPTLARRSNPLSDLDDDHGIDREKILEDDSNADNYKESNTAEEVRPSEIDFEVYDENDKESRRSNRFDDSHESQRMQSNVIAREVGQIRSSPYNDFRSRKPKLSDDNEEEMKRNNFNGFRSQRGSLSPDGKGQMKIINVDDIRLQRDTRNPNCKGEVNVPSRDCAARLTKDGGGLTKRNQLNGFRIQREEINPNCNGTEKVPSRNCTPRLTKDGGGQTKRNQLNGFRIQRNEINHKCKGEPGKPDDEKCDGLLKRINVDDIRIQRDTANPKCKGEEGKLNKRVCNLQMKSANVNGIRIQRGNPNCAGQVGKLDKKGCNLKMNRIDDYNSDEQLTNRENVDGEESRQIHDDRSQHLQPETDEGSPTLARRSNPLSDLDDDHGIDQEKILDADDYKDSNTAEETSHTDDLLALLVRLVRDKRRQTDPLET